MSSEFDAQYVVVHGHKRAYRKAGRGPAVLLIHGLGCDSSTWLPVMPALAEKFTVIAPDLLGHGASDKPIADYSLGGYANGMRDLLTVLGIDRATVVGHSFGGGIAMQFGYQFPARTERLCLVGTGGLGPEVTPAIRLLTLPGIGPLVWAATRQPMRAVVSAALRAAGRLPLRAVHDLNEVAPIYESLADPAASWAIRRVTSGVMSHRRQLISMADRAYLTQLMPVQIIWGEQDAVIPVAHVETALAYAPGARVATFAKAGHFPHKDEPGRFVGVLESFIAETEPAQYHRGRWRSLMRRGVPDGALTAAS